MQRISKIPGVIDFERLKAETQLLMSAHPDQRQLSLQTNGSADWNASTGSRPGEGEGQWNMIHPDLAGTWWQDFFSSLPIPVFRSRIMIMPARVCYSIHTDDNARLHIAVKTHNQAKFIFTRPPEILHIPADGRIYWVNTKEEHTAINGSLEDRVHIVMCLVNNDID